jgi:hypothetical protein
MTLATQTIARSHARLTVTTSRLENEASSHIQILENPIHRHDPALAIALEEALRRILRDESLGFVAVRFRACTDEDGTFQFICKVENPPRVDVDGMVPWRWWSPLLETAEQFAAALQDGLRVRRARLSMARPRS